MKRFFLIDYENVVDAGLKGFFTLPPEDQVFLFYTQNNARIGIPFLEKLLTSPAHAALNFMSVAAGQQALDLQLSSFLGGLIRQHPEGQFFIISKDKGYGCLSSFWSGQEPGVTLAQFQTIGQALQQPPQEPLPAQTPALSPEERISLNTAIIQTLRKAEIESETCSQAASIVIKAGRDKGYKQTIYRNLISKFGQKPGLEVYNQIKPLLN